MRDVLDNFRESQRKKDRAWHSRLVQSQRQHEELEELKRSEVLPKLRPAELKDYREWLRGWIAKGGTPTHSYDSKFNKDCYQAGVGWVPGDWYVAKEDFHLGELCGSQAIQVIVPAAVKFLGGPIGHCNIFLVDGFEVIGGWVPVYGDI